MSDRDRYTPVSRWVGTTDALPGVARIVAATTARSMAWTAGSYVRSGRLLARALTDRKAAEELSTRSPTTSRSRPGPSPTSPAPSPRASPSPGP